MPMLQQSIRAVFFDAAGTLIEVSEPVGATYARFASQFGWALDERALGKAFRQLMPQMPAMVFPGASADRTAELERAWWRDLVGAVLAEVDVAGPRADIDAYFNLLFAYYAVAAAWRTRQGTRTLLTTLRSATIRTGIISNFDHRLRPIVRGLGFESLVDVIVLPADAGAAKPDTRIFLHALNLVGIPPAHAIYVGDDAVQDIAGARAAGLRAVDVTPLRSLSDVATVLGIRV